MAKTGWDFIPSPVFSWIDHAPFRIKAPAQRNSLSDSGSSSPSAKALFLRAREISRMPRVLRRKEGEKVPLPAQVLAGHPKVLGLEDKGR